MPQLLHLVLVILWFQRLVYGIEIPEYSSYANPDFDCPDCQLITTPSSLQGTINTSTDLPTDETTTTTEEPPAPEPTSVTPTQDPPILNPDPTDDEEPQVPTTEDPPPISTSPPIPPITTTTELIIPSVPSSEETLIETTIETPGITSEETRIETTVETPGVTSEETSIITTTSPTVEENIVTLTSELVTTLPSLTTTIYSPVVSTILSTFQPTPIVSSRIYEDRFTQTIVTFVSSAALVIRGTVTEAWSLSCTRTPVPYEITTWKTVSEPINTVEYTVVLSSSPVSHLNYTTWTTFYGLETRTNYAVYGENQVATLTEYQEKCLTLYDYYTELNTYLLWASSTTRTGYSTIVDRNTVLTTLYPEVVTNTLLVTNYVPVATIPIPNVSTIAEEAPSTIYNTVFITEFQTFTVTVTLPTVYWTSTTTETLEGQVEVFTQGSEIQVFTQGTPEIQEQNIAPKISRPSYIIPLLLLMLV